MENAEHNMITFGTEFDLVDTDYSASELWEIDEFARQQLDLEQVQAQPQTYSATSSPINLLSPDPDENPEVYGLNQQQQQQQDGPIATEADQQRDQTTAPVVIVFPQPTDQTAVGPPSPSVAPDPPLITNTRLWRDNKRSRSGGSNSPLRGRGLI
ncbi:hypothetical protein F2P81_026023 [Scophthalmus maximus]|uniref:Uncharacterized protein n=1 Tax=Scophthalmus maximus TaxID=52904 RepID=A0A6A4RSY7_SCOMX|nr:hypothetical protein F2P81_026023 [Scophthalmus maximus]